MMLGQMADMAWNIKCREEDMDHRGKEISWRAEEVWWRAVDDRRRAVDEKAKQLEQISSLSALIAGFALVAMVEISFPDSLSGVLLVSFGSTTAAVVSTCYAGEEPPAAIASTCAVAFSLRHRSASCW